MIPNVEQRIYMNEFKPRALQIPLFINLENLKKKRALLCWPRKYGKDTACWQFTVREAIRVVGTYIYCLPSFAMCKRVLLDSVLSNGKTFIEDIPPDMIQNFNKQEMKIRLINGSIIIMVGSDNAQKRLVGMSARGIVISEAAQAEASGIAYLIPMIAQSEGFLIINSTPRGHNKFWELYNIAKRNPEWYVSKLTVDDTQHISADRIQADIDAGIISEELAQQEYWCFEHDAPILTNNGIVKIGDIKLDDLVLSHSGRFRRIKKLYKRKYSGKMVELRSYGSFETIKCTPDHPVMCYDFDSKSYIFKPAKFITLDDYLVYPKKYISSATKANKFISYELAMLIAWYVSDGSSSKNAVGLAVNYKKAPRVFELLDKLGYNYHFCIKDSVYQIAIKSVNLVDFFKSNCGSICYEKRIPLDLINGHEKEFFYELMKGDGCFVETEENRYNRYSFSTTSKTLAYQVQFLAHSINENLTAGISLRNGYPVKFPHGKTYDARDSYSVQINIRTKKKNYKYLDTKKNSVIAKVKYIGSYDFDDYVYNLGVQYDETYTVAGRSVHNCSFSSMNEGAYYARYVDKMIVEDRITDVPYEPSLPVYVFMDLGWDDSTALIFAQFAGPVIRIIDYYENNGEGLEHYVNVIRNKEYGLVTLYAPHDINVHELGTGVSRLEKLRGLGAKVEVVPKLSIHEGIEAVRTILPRVFIDSKKCDFLVKSIENYVKEKDEKTGGYKDKPRKGKWNHANDALRYLAVSHKKASYIGTSPDELNSRYNRVMYGNSSNLPSALR